MNKLLLVILLMIVSGAMRASDNHSTLDGRFNTPCAPARISGSHLCRISFYRLIATPEYYHEKRVQVTGYLATVFDRSIIFPSRESYQADIQIEGIELIGAKVSDPCEGNKIAKQIPAVTVVGVFDGRYEGADVSRLGSIKIRGRSAVSCAVRIPEN